MSTANLRICAFTLLFGLPAFPVQATDLSGLGHVHGLVVTNNPNTPVLVAAHRGVIQVNADGTFKRISDNQWDMMAFAGNTNPADRLLGSGHPQRGGNLGVVASTDGGISWEKISQGVNGPVDFHLLTISPGNQNWVYGSYKGLQLSKDGGKTWQQTGPLPKDTFDIAAAVKNPEIIYAATRFGIKTSHDSGKTWQPMNAERLPATAIHVTTDGIIMAFIAGQGFVTSSESKPAFKVMSNALGARYFLNIAATAASPNIIFAVDNLSTLWRSVDGGVQWQPFKFSESSDPVVQRGKRLFTQYCQNCHGKFGVGESYTKKSMTDEKYRMAPAMDWSQHAWHHSDENIVETILDSFKNLTGIDMKTVRMPAWRGTITEPQAHDLLAFIKSLWRPKERFCQGPKHMTPACQK